MLHTRKRARVRHAKVWQCDTQKCDSATRKSATNSLSLFLFFPSAMQAPFPVPVDNSRQKYLIRLTLEVRVFPFLQATSGNSTDRHLKFTEEEWKKLIAEASESLTNSPHDLLRDCWFSDRPTDSSGYPNIYPSRWVEGKKGTWMWKRDASSVKMGRLFAMLSHPELFLDLQTKDRSLQAAHRCHHESSMCWNPDHITFTTDKVNKDMNGCHYGCAAMCPHDPICIWTDENGIIIPCRNARPLQNCTCPVNCYSKKGNQTPARGPTTPRKAKK